MNISTISLLIFFGFLVCLFVPIVVLFLIYLIKTVIKKTKKDSLSQIKALTSMLRTLEFQRDYLKIAAKALNTFSAVYAVYLGINPVLSVIFDDQTVFAKYISICIMFPIMLLSEFRLQFKSEFMREWLKPIWLFSIPTVSIVYTILLIINFIPTIVNDATIGHYFSSENKGIILGGLVVFIACRRFIDDLLKRSRSRKDQIKKKSVSPSIVEKYHEYCSYGNSKRY